MERIATRLSMALFIGLTACAGSAGSGLPDLARVEDYESTLTIETREQLPADTVLIATPAGLWLEITTFEMEGDGVRWWERSTVVRMPVRSTVASGVASLARSGLDETYVVHTGREERPRADSVLDVSLRADGTVTGTYEAEVEEPGSSAARHVRFEIHGTLRAVECDTANGIADPVVLGEGMAIACTRPIDSDYPPPR